MSRLFFIPPLFLLVAALSAADSSPPPVDAADGSTAVVELEKLHVHATPFARSANELAETVSVLAGPQLDARRAPTLGETLDGAPGVSSTYFGPGASRPLIRGLGGERIRILSNGLGSADVSGTSPDHAVSIEPALIERVEVLRGPSALLYGSSAVGGLVNVVDHQVPGENPATATGFLEASYGTAANEKAAVAHASGPAGDVAWQLSLQRRRSEDIDIPGFAEAEHDDDHEEEEGEEDQHDHEEEEERGVLANSAIDTRSGSVGASWFGKAGFIGFGVSALDTRYGVPGHAHAHHEEEEEEEEEHEEGEEEHHDDEGGVRIDLQQRRFDLRAEITEPFGGFRSARWRFGAADYRHLELEGDEIGTRFDTESWESRLDLLHEPFGPFEGAIGAHLQHTTFSAEGDEAFLPPTRTRNRALFLLEEVSTGAMRWQFGARWESQGIAVRDGSGRRRNVDALSTSAGGLWSLDQDWALAFSLARTGRAPTAQELYANGPHLATRAFERGDPDLARERSTGLDVSLRRRAGIVTGALTVFVNDFDGFIIETPTGDEEDGLPVYRYVQPDARFSGAELEVTWHLHEVGWDGMELTFTADTVRATNRSTGEPLPRIPAVRAGLALAYANERWTAGGEVRHTAGQSRVAPLEDPSDGYTLLSLFGAWRVPVGESAVQLFARVSNLTNQEARPHTSFLRDLAPLPGRNVTLGARWEF